MAAISILVSVVVAGQRYFYCALMNEVSLDACCAPGSEHSADDAPAVDREACCTTAHFAAQAPGTFAPEPPVLAAPLVAVLPIATPTSAPPASSPPAFARFARAGPGDPSPREHRLRLMVFLT